MTDEQRVALWVANRKSLGWRFTRVFDVEVTCLAFWAHKGIRRQSSTWLRAFWRARAAGMLGPVEKPERVGGRYRYRITGTVRDIRRAAGAEYKPIPHGKRKGVIA